MEDTEKQQPNMRKSIASIILLLALLIGLVYAAPMLTEKLRENSEKEKAEQAPTKVLIQPQTSAELEAWLPLVTSQFPKLEDGSVKYILRYMLLNEDKSELLLDLKEGENGEPFDLILKRDQFGRYVSDDANLSIKLYPPEG